MHQLPDIIKAIALNNKLDESRDLAGMVQEALVSNLKKTNRDIRSRGVKKAPFVVLIGAAMPSVLAEISFITNRQELQLLKTGELQGQDRAVSLRRGAPLPPLPQGRHGDHRRTLTANL
jgi:N-acetylmuramoyl-L-alanine amidase